MKTNGSAPRQASIHRATKETDISVEWTLDGSGLGKIDTGIRFFDHMLELLSKHGFFDLTVKAKGDIDIDEGRCMTLTSISDFVDNLARSGWFKKPVEIVDSHVEPGSAGSGELIRFTIKAQVASPAG